MSHIACFHLLNDYSGSPIVLSRVLRGLLDRGCQIDLTCSKGGVLDTIEDDKLHVHHYSYHFSTNPMVTLIRWAWVQLYTFATAFRFIGRQCGTFYINTLLPVGPAIAGRLMGKRVVYHYHEDANAKGAFYRMLSSAMQRLAHRIICVSAYQAAQLKRQDKVTVVHNALATELAARLGTDADKAFERKNILMISSLKAYKGTAEFIGLAQKMPQYHFTLVINDEQSKIDLYLRSQNINVPGNLTIHPRQTDVALFYNNASIVLSLSNKALFIETFGLTALEAMTAGLPIIVPTVGGIAEMVDDGVNGYKIDVCDIDNIERTIKLLLTDRALFTKMAAAAKAASAKYDERNMTEDIARILSK